jgi:hypothetical protein
MIAGEVEDTGILAANTSAWALAANSCARLRCSTCESSSLSIGTSHTKRMRCGRDGRSSSLKSYPGSSGMAHRAAPNARQICCRTRKQAGSTILRLPPRVRDALVCRMDTGGVADGYRRAFNVADGATKPRRRRQGRLPRLRFLDATDIGCTNEFAMRSKSCNGSGNPQRAR